MIDHKQSEPGTAATDLTLTETPLIVPSGVTAEHSLTTGESLLDISVRAIKCQRAADITFDLIRSGQQVPNFLETTFAALDADCRSAFLRQIAKRIEGVK